MTLFGICGGYADAVAGVSHDERAPAFCSPFAGRGEDGGSLQHYVVVTPVIRDVLARLGHAPPLQRPVYRTADRLSPIAPTRSRASMTPTVGRTCGRLGENQTRLRAAAPLLSGLMSAARIRITHTRCAAAMKRDIDTWSRTIIRRFTSVSFLANSLILMVARREDDYH